MGVRSVKLDPALGFSARQDAADFPALKYWFLCHDGAGSTIVRDYGKSGGGGASILSHDTTIVGAGDAWSRNDGIVTGDGVTGPSVYAISSAIMTGDILPAISGKSAIILLDFTPLVIPAATMVTHAFGQGTSTASAGRGFTLMHDTNGMSRIRITGESNAPGNLQFTLSALPAGVRRREVIVWDRTSTSQGNLRLYRNGAFIQQNTLASDPGLVTLAGSTSKVAIGARGDATQQHPHMVTHEAQLWAMTSLPSPDLVGIYMSANRRLPSNLDGVT